MTWETRPVTPDRFESPVSGIFSAYAVVDLAEKIGLIETTAAAAPAEVPWELPGSQRGADTLSGALTLVSDGFCEVDGDVEISGDLRESFADVAGGAEPELVAVGEPGGEGLTDEQPG